MSKIKEKKINSIKSELEEIKKFIDSSNNVGDTEKKIYYSNNNNEDTLTLTKIVNKENNLENNNLSEIKKELKELKEAIVVNKNLLNEILLKIK